MSDTPSVSAGSAANAKRAGLAAAALRHPLLLLVVGAAISALVVPIFTQRWQDHQRALDVQTALVSEMTAAVTSYSLDIDYAHFRLGEAGADRVEWNQQLDAIYRRWQLKRSVIRSRLLAYYNKGPVLATWDRLSSLLLLVWRSAPRGDEQPFAADERRTYAALVGKPLHLTGSGAWVEAMIAVDALRDKAVERVLEATPTV